MHEASIALSVLEIAVDNCRKAGYNRIESIRLKIGRASGIMTDALLLHSMPSKQTQLRQKQAL